MTTEQNSDLTIKQKEEKYKRNYDLVKIKINQIKSNLIYGYLECSDVTNNFERAKILREHLTYLDGIITNMGTIPWRFFDREIKVGGVNWHHDDITEPKRTDCYVY